MAGQLHTETMTALLRHDVVEQPYCASSATRRQISVPEASQCTNLQTPDFLHILIPKMG